MYTLLTHITDPILTQVSDLHCIFPNYVSSLKGKKDNYIHFCVEIDHGKKV